MKKSKRNLFYFRPSIIFPCQCCGPILRTSVFACASIILTLIALYHNLYRLLIDEISTKRPTQQYTYQQCDIQYSVIPRTTTILHKPLETAIQVYLIALQRSVQIINLPDELSTVILDLCDELKDYKPPLLNHQHSLEIRFPRMLRRMHQLSGNASFDPIWTSTADNNDSPLFFYLESFAYHAIYCTKKSRQKEDWTKRDPYWKQVAAYFIKTEPWKHNMGLNFLAPASHPASGPSRHHPVELSYLQRVSFLKADFDVAGSSPRDIIVPYFADKITSKIPFPRRPIKWLIFFAGGKNPLNGYRDLLGGRIAEYSGLNTMHGSKILYTTNFIAEYIDEMMQSQFCLIVRGDTTSSRRLFTSIKVGCIPVIVSDWIKLPFSDLIDYSKFTVTFPESIANNVSSMVEYLAGLRESQLVALRSSLEVAQHLLLYDEDDDDDGSERGTSNAGLLSNCERIRSEVYAPNLVQDNNFTANAATSPHSSSGIHQQRKHQHEDEVSSWRHAALFQHTRALFQQLSGGPMLRQAHGKAGSNRQSELGNTSRRTVGISVPKDKSVLNPVTLTLIQALMTREKMCQRNFADRSHISDMCSNIQRRMAAARASLSVLSSQPQTLDAVMIGSS